MSSEWFEKYVQGLKKVGESKLKMVARNLLKAKCNCPVCDGKDKLFIRLAPQKRDPTGFHARWKCECGFTGME